MKFEPHTEAELQRKSAPSYRARLNIGQLYERYICKRFWYKPISDLYWQDRYGDTLCKVEIKYDRLLHKTGNLFIEKAEKGHASQPNFKLAGPYKKCRKYLIGDCARVLIFDPAVLRDEIEAQEARELGTVLRVGYSIKTTPTAIGLVLPYECARDIATREYAWPVDPLFCER